MDNAAAEQNSRRDDPAPVKIAGDWLDDDPQIIDDLVQSDPIPPGPGDLPHEPDPVPVVAPRNPTRLQSRSFRSVSLFEPLQVLPEDLDRTTLCIINNDPTTYFIFGEDRQQVSSANLASYVTSNAPVFLDGHTGALWVMPIATATRQVVTDGSVAITFSVTAVTK